MGEIYSAYSVESADGIGRITLDQPARGNPFDLAFCTQLSEIATEFDEDPSIRCVLIDAQGGLFSVGGDLKSLAGGRDELPRFIKNATAGLHMGLSRLSRMRAPVVVAVHGLAVGGAVSLCAAADFVVAARSASFYAGYTGIGLVPDAGGSTFLPRRVGTRRATSFLMRNQRWSAEEALGYGLVSDVVDDAALTDSAWDLARELAAGPTVAFGEIKNLLHSTFEQPIEAQMELEARAMARVTRSEDAWGAINAVLAKQKPEFHGR